MPSLTVTGVHSITKFHYWGRLTNVDTFVRPLGVHINEVLLCHNYHLLKKVLRILIQFLPFLFARVGFFWGLIYYLLEGIDFQ